MTVLGYFLYFLISLVCSLALAGIASVESVKVKNKTRSFRFQSEVFWVTFFFAMVFFIYAGDHVL